MYHSWKEKILSSVCTNLDRKADVYGRSYEQKDFKLSRLRAQPDIDDPGRSIFSVLFEIVLVIPTRVQTGSRARVYTQLSNRNDNKCRRDYSTIAPHYAKTLEPRCGNRCLSSRIHPFRGARPCFWECYVPTTFPDTNHRWSHVCTRGMLLIQRTFYG